ncbi:MAG: hypothetical protein H6719_27210 [Sandaracinaceae bacterium]|nr:hypothetical protein [Sandaracinaceae bacterium]
MRRLLLLSTFVLCLALPRVSSAQDTEVAEGAPAQEETVGEDGGYEPDQRGNEEDRTGGGEDTATGDTDYEPDQRGAEDDEGGGDGGGTGGEAEPAEARTEADSYVLESAGDSAARRGLGFDLQVFGGLGVTGLDAFGGDNLVRDDQRGSVGGSFGVGLGLGLGPLTLGPRLSFTAEPAFVLGAIGLDIQVALTSGWIAPTLRLGLSYAFLLSYSDPLPSQNTADGFWAELGIGVRVHVVGPFMLGGELAGGWIAMFRGEVPGCTDPCRDGSFDVSMSGAANGATLRLHVFAGLSF